MKKTKIKPIHDLVLIKPNDPETITQSGIIIPDVAIEKQMRGVVIATGDGIKDEPMMVKKGDEVLYKKAAGIEIEYEEKMHILIKQTEIMAIL